MYRMAQKRLEKGLSATPDKSPQKKLNDKKCRNCGTLFSPLWPAHLYCSDDCAHAKAVDKYLKRTYGISSIDFKQLKENSNLKCSICGSDGFVLNKNSVFKLAIDHDHSTGKVRGLLCHNCNRALGLFKDSIENLKSAISYLEGATTISKESTPK